MKNHITLMTALSAPLLLALASCQSPTSNGPTTPSTADNTKNGLPKTVIVTVHDEVEQPAGTKVFVSCEIDSGGIPIALGPGKTLACNGTAMIYDDAANMYKGAVAQVATGDRFSFTLTDSMGAHFLCDVLEHERPVISSPTSGAAIERSGQFRIHYAAEAGTIGIASTVRDNPMTITPQSTEPDNGESAMYDLTGLPAGPGWVQIVRHYQSSHVDLGFRSIESNLFIGKVSGVTWQ